MTPKEVLIAAKALIDSPEKWGKGGIDDLRKKPCAFLACCEVRGGRLDDIAWDAVVLLGKAAGSPIMTRNDEPGTTHADVMAWFQRAIEACES